MISPAGPCHGLQWRNEKRSLRVNGASIKENEDGALEGGLSREDGIEVVSFELLLLPLTVQLMRALGVGSCFLGPKKSENEVVPLRPR